MECKWLTLYHDIEDRNKKRVKIIENKDDVISNKNDQVRTSPIFPISGEYELPDSKKDFFVQFYFVNKPFTTLVEILRIIENQDIKGQIWISHGNASILFISNNEERKRIIENLFLDEKKNKILDRNIIGIQEWKIKNNELEKSPILLNPDQPTFNTELDIEDYSRLPSNLQNQVTEFLNSINTLINRSEIYAPDFTEGYSSLIDEINEIIIQLDYLFNQDSNIPEELSDRKEWLQEENNRLILINELTEEIVQLNSALSYVISQGFSGIIPIEENPSFVHSHSLLGVGTAHKSLKRFYKYISNVFSEYPIDTIIEEYYDVPENPPYHSLYSDYLEEWKEKEKWTIDKYLERIEGRENFEYLVFFSGRQGFSQSRLSISAAIQSLHLGITSRWNIITSTHEIMHSHVRAIYSLIQNNMKKYSWDEIGDFLDNPTEDLSLMEGIFLIILNFARSYFHFKQFGFADSDSFTEDLKHKSGTTNPSLLDRVNIEIFDLANEIMVHTLDFHYFYQNNPKIYIKQIWLSWATLPTTPLKVREYLLRTISAIATIEDHQNPEIRLRNACEKTKDVLEELIEIDDSVNNKIYKQAIEKLQNRPSNFNLLLRACLYLAEATKCFLYSEELQMELFKDQAKKEVQSQKGSEVEKELDYHLDVGEFRGESITNPVSFVLNILDKSIAEHGNRDLEEDQYNTLWLHFVCSSLRKEGEESNV